MTADGLPFAPAPSGLVATVPKGVHWSLAVTGRIDSILPQRTHSSDAAGPGAAEGDGPAGDCAGPGGDNAGPGICAAASSAKSAAARAPARRWARIIAAGY